MVMGTTHLQDLPDAILTTIFALLSDTRSRNAASLVSHRWRALERSTRTSLTLRGNVRHLFQLPTCFPAIVHLDLSLLSPWGYSFLDHDHHVVAACLRRAFPKVVSLTVYGRTPSTVDALARQWPGMRRVKIARWHQRPPSPLGADLVPLLEGCPGLTELDLSSFYCWTEDVAVALQSSRFSSANSLTRLDLVSRSSLEGFKSTELVTISMNCPKLEHLSAPCVFDPRYNDFVGDEALLAIARNCKGLTKLHLVDQSAVSNLRTEVGDGEGIEAGITSLGLEDFFSAIPAMEDLVLDVCHNVTHVGPAMEVLSRRCTKLRSLKLGRFQGVCRAKALHLDGIAVCGGLTALSLKNSADLTDSGLVAIARGCSRLSKLELLGCRLVTEVGLRKMVSMLRSTLVDVSISCCMHLDAARTLSALEPIRDRIERLHIDCVWSTDDQDLPDPAPNGENNSLGLDIDDQGDECLEEECSAITTENGCNLTYKKCRFSEGNTSCFDESNELGFWCKTWNNLRYLSLWVPVGELLLPLADLGLERCPELEEICIKIEGDCRNCPVKLNQAFGLISLINYPALTKMKLDCGDVIGYVLTAPEGQMDLSLWERFYLSGIEKLSLAELDYRPPQDRDMNQRSLSLPAVALLAQCATLRKLFIHGTANEHFLGFLLNIPNLRDVQLREDYYPAPDNDTSTEMRVDSCSRFEDALNRRLIPD